MKMKYKTNKYWKAKEYKTCIHRRVQRNTNKCEKTYWPQTEEDWVK